MPEGVPECYCVMLHLETEDAVLIAAALALAPSILDNKVWARRPVDHEVKPVPGVGAHVEVRFNTEADATELYDAARELSGIKDAGAGTFPACRKGEAGSSYVHVHKCYIPKEGCKIITAKQMKST